MTEADLAQPASLEDLHDALVKEAECYRQLVALTEQEHQALRAGDLARLQATVHDKGRVLQSLSQGEHLRETIVAQLGERLNLPPAASLSDIIAQADETATRGLAALRLELRTLLERLLVLNHGSHLLLQSELERVNATFDYLMSSVASSERQYTASGDDRSQPARGNVLNWQI